MISFVTFGSWGEIAPLLEIALQFRDEGLETQLVTTPEWVDAVEAYGIKCHAFSKQVAHADSIQAFLETRLCGQMQSQAEELEAILKGSALIIGAMFAWPAAIAAKRLGVEYRATTTTPIYHAETEPVEAFARCVKEYLGITGEFIPIRAICLSPWFFNDGRLPCPGYPKLRELGELSEEVSEFIRQPHAAIACGTIVQVDRLNAMVDAIHAVGLKCLYLGRLECNADLSLAFDVRRPQSKALKNASVCITHAGVGTTLDCLGSSMVVAPVAYDQHYNAQKLVDCGAAVMLGDDSKESIERAMKIRPSLESNWSLRAFARLL